jgi:hypothetical protein
MWYPDNLIFPEPKKLKKVSTQDDSIGVIVDPRLYEVLNGRVYDSKSKRLARKK